MSLPSLGGSSSSKKSKDKRSISRSQSQRPAGDKDCGPQRLTAVLSKVAEDKATVEADAGLKQDSLSEPKSQHEPAIDITNTENTPSGPTSDCEHVSPSGGSSSDKQDITQAGADLTTDSGPEPLKEESSPPLDQGNDQTQQKGEDNEHQNSDSISRWVFSIFFLNIIQLFCQDKEFYWVFPKFTDWGGGEGTIKLIVDNNILHFGTSWDSQYAILTNESLIETKVHKEKHKVVQICNIIVY